MFKKLYNKILRWAEHTEANKFLFGLSFAESSFFPIPPDVMLLPMCLAKPQKRYYLAGLTTLASVLGGVLGYLIGYFLFDLVEPLLKLMHYGEKLNVVKTWFDTWGFWAILIAGFSPIPYKLFTVSAGLMGMVFVPFLLASVIGRGARFFLLAFLVSLGGDQLKERLNEYIETIGWVVSGGIVLVILVYQL